MSGVPPPKMQLLTEERANSLIAAITSASYEEYCIRCALAGVEPMAPVRARSGLTAPSRIIRNDRYLDEITSWDGKYIL